MSARMTTLVLVSTAGLMLSSCSLGWTTTLDEEPAFTTAAAMTLAESNSESETSSSSPTSSTTTSSHTTASCGEDKKLKDTEIGKVLEKKISYVKDSTKKLENIRVEEDEFDACQFLSYVVLTGKLDGEQVKVPVFFVNGEVYDEEAVFITTGSLTITKDGDGYAYTADGAEGISGVEGTVGKRPGTEAPSMHSTFDGSIEEVLFLDMSSEPTASADLAEDEEDLRGENLFYIRAGSWGMACGIDEEAKSIDCAHDGGGWRVEGGKADMMGDMEFGLVSLLPLEGNYTFSQLGDKTVPTHGKRIDENGLYRIGQGDIEGQIAVVDGDVVISTPTTGRLLFTADTVVIDSGEDNDSAAGVEAA
ncbi:hypothetical protein HMPREF3149_11030 [Corynebacterium sp. HMSC05E07]|nr:hypothetical protein HMPREF3149_11030 [Corynebacterium sp. HMSC05E07]